MHFEACKQKSMFKYNELLLDSTVKPVYNGAPFGWKKKKPLREMTWQHKFEMPVLNPGHWSLDFWPCHCKALQSVMHKFGPHRQLIKNFESPRPRLKETIVAVLTLTQLFPLCGKCAWTIICKVTHGWTMQDSCGVVETLSVGTRVNYSHPVPPKHAKTCHS